MANLALSLIWHHIVTVIIYSETLNCRIELKLHMPKLRHMINLEKKVPVGDLKSVFIDGTLAFFNISVVR